MRPAISLRIVNAYRAVKMAVFVRHLLGMYNRRAGGHG